MEKELRILFLEDSPTDVELIKMGLRKAGLHFTPSLASNREQFEEQLGAFNPDIILSDHSLPQFDSLSALKIAKEERPEVPFILVTGSVSEEFAVACIKSGAEDYVLKDNLIRLPSIIRGALHKSDLKNENTLIKNLNSKLHQANELIAEKNKDITDSINYSQRIQSAILPDAKIMRSYFPESFVLYMPKDVISGDFYWFAQYHGKFIVAVADCTGHGVPGALLTMVGFNLIKNSVFIKGFSNPAQILNELNQSFCDIFKVHSGSSIQDGMDIAICSIDITTRLLEFAGARRPFYLMRNNAIEEMKGSPIPIGGTQQERVPYKSEIITLEKGDRIYLFTDGYSDQFGGNRSKKLKTKGLRDILMKVNNVPVSQQGKALKQHLDMWMQNETQTDDVLIAGLEISKVAMN